MVGAADAGGAGRVAVAVTIVGGARRRPCELVRDGALRAAAAAGDVLRSAAGRTCRGPGLCLAHPEVRHRELAWRMVDEDVVCLSPSTVYRILREANLICPSRRRKKRSRPEEEKAPRPNQRWATDLLYLRIGERWYYLVSFLDEYSRYLVHWELLSSMDGHSVSLAAQRAVETLPRDATGKLLARPEIRSDNGSCFVSREFRHGAGRARADPPPNQAALPRGERDHGAVVPNGAGSLGGRGMDGSPRGGGAPSASDRLVQQRAFAPGAATCGRSIIIAAIRQR